MSARQTTPWAYSTEDLHQPQWTRSAVEIDTLGSPYAGSVLTRTTTSTSTRSSRSTITPSQISGTGATAARALHALGTTLLSTFEYLAIGRKLRIAKSLIPHRNDSRRNDIRDVYADLLELVFRHDEYPTQFSQRAHELLILQLRWRIDGQTHSQHLIQALEEWPVDDVCLLSSKWPTDCVQVLLARLSNDYVQRLAATSESSTASNMELPPSLLSEAPHIPNTILPGDHGTPLEGRTGRLGLRRQSSEDKAITDSYIVLLRDTRRFMSLVAQSILGTGSSMHALLQPDDSVTKNSTPLPRLKSTGTLLLAIWDALRDIREYRWESLSLALRCTALLLYAQAYHLARDRVGDTARPEAGILQAHLTKPLEGVLSLLQRQAKQGRPSSSVLQSNRLGVGEAMDHCSDELRDSIGGLGAKAILGYLHHMVLVYTPSTSQTSDGGISAFRLPLPESAAAIYDWYAGNLEVSPPITNTMWLRRALAELDTWERQELRRLDSRMIGAPSLGKHLWIEANIRPILDS